MEYLIRIASGDGTFKVNLYAPGQRTHYRSMKVRRTHLVYLNSCRLIGGGSFKVKDQDGSYIWIVLCGCVSHSRCNSKAV